MYNLAMGFEDELEKGKSSSPKTSKGKLTLKEAIELGEYDPDYLSAFPEWCKLSLWVQFQFIRRGIENRRKRLRIQWAEINNVLDFRLKPHLKKTLLNIEKQLKKVDEDEERLYLEYSSRLDR